MLSIGSISRSITLQGKTKIRILKHLLQWNCKTKWRKKGQFFLSITPWKINGKHTKMALRHNENKIRRYEVTKYWYMFLIRSALPSLWMSCHSGLPGRVFGFVLDDKPMQCCTYSQYQSNFSREYSSQGTDQKFSWPFLKVLVPFSHAPVYQQPINLLHWCIWTWWINEKNHYWWMAMLVANNTNPTKVTWLNDS